MYTAREVERFLVNKVLNLLKQQLPALLEILQADRWSKHKSRQDEHLNSFIHRGMWWLGEFHAFHSDPALLEKIPAF